MTYNQELRFRQKRFIRHRAYLINFALDNGYELTAGEAYRSAETQQMHVNAGRSLTMNSMHLIRLADDYNIFIQLEGSDYLLFSVKENEERDLQLAKPLGDYWCTLDKDNRWGGDFDNDGNPLNGKLRDGGHFENKFRL